MSTMPVYDGWGVPPQKQFPAAPHLQLEHEYDIPSGNGSFDFSQQGDVGNGEYMQQFASGPPASAPQFYSTQFSPPSNGHAASGTHQHRGVPYSAAPGGSFYPSSGPGLSASDFTFTSQPQFKAGAPPYPPKNPSTSYTPAYDYHGQFAAGQSAPATNFHANDGGLTPPQVSPPMLAPFQRTGAQHYKTKSDLHASKRPRGAPNADDGDDDDNHVPENAQDGGAKIKPPGACSRCKSLKVKCESSSDTDPCKRCLNGGHECITPGRKKRRVPPKREHLLKEIREQASEIQRLMALLEETKAPSPSSSGDADLHSPTLGSYDSKPEVRDWLAEARASIDAFGGLIGAGGAGMTKSLLVDEDPEDSESDPDAYEEAVEDLYGEGSGVDESPRSEDRARSTSKERDPAPKRSSGDKLATIPSGASPFGLMADMALKKSRRRRSSVGSNADDVGLANDNFFRPSPGPDPARTASNGSHQEPQVPHILSRGIITTKEAEKLFSIYFDYMNLSVSLLDPVIYTAQNTCWRNPFLFTVICAIASRFYTERPELYHQIMKYAQLAAGTALISGQKSVDVCHAYILMCLYPVPARRWEEDRSWIYLGLAIRIAIDLNLHHPNTATPLNEHHAREMLNRSRLWLNCFNLDRSTGSQYGKTPIIPSTDYVANNSVSWWCSSAYNLSNFDVHTCAYNSELRVMGAFLQKIYNDPKHPTGLNKEADFEKIAIETDDDLVSLGDRWFKCLEQGDTTNPQFCFRTGLLRLAYSYARLLALSFGFQHAFGKNNTDENPFLLRCYRAASDVVNTILNDVARPSQRVYLRHGPEAQSVFVTFACAFLVKLLQPKFASYLSREQREEIRSLVQQVIDLLGSPDIAIDDRHGPKLYSRFLKGLLATPMARVDSQSPSDLKTRQPSLPRQSSSETSIESITGSSVYVTSPGEDAPLSPQPTSATSMAFDQFAPLLDGAESLAPTGRRASLDTQPMLNMDATDLFRPPLPFDDELLQSMQQLSNHAWHDTAIPGFAWMNQMPSPAPDVHMQSADPGSTMMTEFPFN